LVLITLLYAFVADNERIVDPIRILWDSLTMDVQRVGASYAVLSMVLLSIGFASTLIGIELLRTREFESLKGILGALGVSAVLSIGAAFAFGLGLATRVGDMMTVSLMQTGDVLNMSSMRAGLFDYYSIYVFLFLFLMALILTTEHRKLPTVLFSSRLSILVLVPGILFAFAWINSYNLNPVRADMVYSLGQKFDGVRDWDFAFALYKRSVTQAPEEDVYLRGLGAAFLRKASSTDAARAQTAQLFDEQTPLQSILDLDAQRTAELSALDLLSAAQSAFGHGRQINPLNADQTAGLAHVYQYRATLTDDATQKSKLTQLSSQFYAQATSLTPRDNILVDEWQKLGSR
jgi:hypothetical protein